MIVKQKFAQSWLENFLFSKTFEFRVILVYILHSKTLIFEQNFFSAELAQR